MPHLNSIFLKALFAMFGLLAILVIVFFFWASSSRVPAHSYAVLVEAPPGSVKKVDSIYSIVTYNIGYLSGLTNNRPVQRIEDDFKANQERVLKELKRYDPDFMSIQEIDFDSDRSFNINQQEEIRKTADYHVFQAINWDKRYVPFPYWPISMHFGKVVSGQSTFSKYPYQSIDRIALDRPKSNPFYYDAFYIDRLALVSKIKMENSTLILINVHLEAFDKATRVIHMERIAELVKSFKDSFPVILAGDFNSDPAYPEAAIHMLMRIPGISFAEPDDQMSHTFPSDQPRVRIDYIFYNDAFIDEIESGVLTSFGQSSDHLPVYMKFKMK